MKDNTGDMYEVGAQFSDCTTKFQDAIIKDLYERIVRIEKFLGIYDLIYGDD